jgi:hypothetical protein
MVSMSKGGGEDMEVRVEDQIVAEGMDGGDGSEFAIGEIEASKASRRVSVAVWKRRWRRWRRSRRLRKMPRRILGMVKTNWRWGTS